MGTNNFLPLPVVAGGSAAGPQAAIDLWSLVPTTGLSPPISVVGAGRFTGTIAVEASLDGTGYSFVGFFTVGSLAPSDPDPDLTPILITDVVRFLRLRVMGATRIIDDTSFTIGGAQNCDCPASAASVDTLIAEVAVLEATSMLIGGVPADLQFDLPDDGKRAGTLAAFNQVPSLYVSVPIATYNPGTSTPLAIIGTTDTKVWIRADQMGLPLQSNSTFYVGRVGTSVSPTGTSPSDGFGSIEDMAVLFFFNTRELNSGSDIVILDLAPVPTVAGGDFDDAFGAEGVAGVEIFAGDMLKLVGPNGFMDLALGDSQAHLDLCAGVALNHCLSSAGPNNRRGVLVGFANQRNFNPEIGITFVPGDSIWLSATTPGKVTNVSTGLPRIGKCLSNTESGMIGYLLLK